MATHITNYKIQLHNDLYKFLVCQKCEEVPKYGPIYTCDAGDHATCTDCFGFPNLKSLQMQSQDHESFYNIGRDPNDFATFLQEPKKWMQHRFDIGFIALS
jgi:hypothetical protein